MAPLTNITHLGHLSPLLNGDALEYLAGDLADPGAEMSPGKKLQLAADCRRLAEYMETTGKAAACDMLRGGIGAAAVMTDEGVVFDYKAPGKRSNLDEPNFRHQYPEAEYESLYGQRKVETTAIRRAFPPGDYPDLWITTPTSERVDVKL